MPVAPVQPTALDLHPPATCLVVRVGPHRGSVVSMQLSGFERFRDDVRRTLGLEVIRADVASLECIAHPIAAHRPDVAIVLTGWNEPADKVEAAFRFVRSQPYCARLVFLDSFDPTSSPYMGLLGIVDRYLKSKVLRNIGEYDKPYVGGHVLSDFAARSLRYDLGDWYFGSSVPAEHAHKLQACWNFGISPDFQRLLRAASFAPAWKHRPFEVNRRLALSTAEERTPTSWYAAYRGAAARALEPLTSRYRCTGTRRVSRKRYAAELLLSRVVFSPFGWGEVCFRDYEAACAGALLVKPSMDHVRTSPDIFVDGETYVSVAWDFSDTTAKIEACLRDPVRSARIAANAREAMRAYFEQHGFVRDLERALQGIVPMRGGRPA